MRTRPWPRSGYLLLLGALLAGLGLLISPRVLGSHGVADLAVPLSLTIGAAGGLLILVAMVLYVTMVYGPIAAFLVELFPTRIRYTSMSLPYHIVNGWFGGMLPLLATALVARSGNIYHGLWYPIAVSLMTVIVGALFLRETKDRSIAE